VGQTIGWKNSIKDLQKLKTKPETPLHFFDWKLDFPEVMNEQVTTNIGFDIVIGNPPYIRQELLSPFKPYLQENYQTYDGVADIYIYFYEKGLNLLKPAGIISYIVTNKWLRSGYGEPLRRFFSQESVFEQIIDFGHAYYSTTPLAADKKAVNWFLREVLDGEKSWNPDFA
jgi:methylase of polypeptide subunit release factors